MKIIRILIPLILTVAMAAMGCAQDVSPVAPSGIDAAVGASKGDTSHNLLGLFTFVCEPDKGKIDVIALRDAGLHLNALKFLEPPPLVYLTLEGPPQFSGNILDVDIGLTNPYLGLDEYTGFDVCGIVFAHGSVTGFADPEITTAGEGDTRLLNADGYTRWWNPAEFPHGDTVFSYIDGKLGTPADHADFNCTINGYKYFADGLSKDNPLATLDMSKRGMFGAGKKNIRHYTIDMSGGLIFNYAVDACWKKPIGSPPYTPPDDFPPGANRREAWNISITEIESNLHYDENTTCAGGYMKLMLDVYDHFNAGINEVHAESVAGIPLTSALAPTGGGEGYSTYELDITGTELVQNGDADLLIAVESEFAGYGGALPGRPVCSYFTHGFEIKRGWAQTWGGTKFDYGMDIALDNAGNIYVVGVFYGTVDFDPGPGTDWHTSAHETTPDVFLCRYDDCGAYQWTYTWGGPNWTQFETPWMYWLAADDAGNIYVTGSFSGTVDFDPGPGTDEHTAAGNYDIFLSKFDAGGDFQWVRTWGGPADNKACGATTDASGNVYVTGYSQGWLNNYLFLARLSPGGDLLWAVSWDGSDSLGVAADGFGNVYVTGLFYGTVDFDPGSGIEERTAEDSLKNAFLSKFDSNGDFVWVRAWGAPNINLDNVNGRFVDVDEYGDIYVAGIFYDTVDFDPGAGFDEHASHGWQDIFLSKFDSQGGFHWTRTWGGIAWDFCQSIVAHVGYVYIAGGFSNEVDFDPGPGTDWHDATEGSAFLSKFDMGGDFQWARTWAGSGRGVDLADSGNIYVTGHFGGTGDFDPGPGTQYHTASGFNVFLSKFPPDGNW